jgi:type I restriction enzyme, R subunit
MDRLPDHLASFNSTLLFDYESTGTETLFGDMRDPHPWTVFAFHTPQTLLDWATENPSLMGRLASLPDLDPSGLRQCQIEAITGTDRLPGLEASLARCDPRILMQMATGAGKTFLACTFLCRLIKYAKVRRVLFIADRTSDHDSHTLQSFCPLSIAGKSDP